MLTTVAIEKLSTPDKRREVPDGRIKGLYLVLQRSGARSWALRYRFGGVPKKYTIGPYPALELATARRRAQEALGDIAKGIDPAAVKRASKAAAKAVRENADDRVEQVANLFLERYVKGNVSPSWARETERLLRTEIVPKLGAKRLSEVKKPDIHDLLDGIVDRGAPVVANRTLAVLRKMFGWSVERGIVAASPVDKVKSPTPENSRDRVLNDDEIKFVWAAFESVGWPFGPFAKLLLLTGARRDEVASAHWHEVDFDAKN